MKAMISARGVSKSYRIGQRQTRYLSLRDSLWEMPKRLFKGGKETFWALRDVDFDVMPGECVGIIGRNGAGKSTLLKILSRITPPTRGGITMRGRVASLLEVGTGFHPELTGRENIFLNGSILGMRQREIKAGFDEIVAFSGVETFLDTPLKHYSSGMQLRLAFAVAAHLRPEILLIDEVLAVGDAEFQKKCLGKMDEVSKSGRTVIFVSHDLGAVRRLCPKSILLDKGELLRFLPTSEILDAYSSLSKIKEERATKSQGFGEGQYFNIRDFSILNQDFQAQPSFSAGDTLRIRFSYECSQNISHLNLGFAIHNSKGHFITVLNNHMSGHFFERLPKRGVIQCDLERLPFMYGDYYADLNIIIDHAFRLKFHDLLALRVEENDFYASGDSNSHKRSGVYIPQKWHYVQS